MPQLVHGSGNRSSLARALAGTRPGRHGTSLVAGVVVAVLAASGATPADLAPPGMVTAATGQRSATPVPAAVLGAAAEDRLAAVPVAFVTNRGQTDPRVRYYAVGDRFAFFATRDEVMLSLTKDGPGSSLALALRFLDRNPRTTIAATRKAPGTVNYLNGRQPSPDRTGLGRYRELVYRDLWPRIDLRLRERAGVLKYEFHVRPGRPGLGHPPRVRRRSSTGHRRGRRVADQDGAGHPAGLPSGELPDDLRQPRPGAERLPARRPRQVVAVRVRRRSTTSATASW